MLARLADRRFLLVSTLYGAKPYIYSLGRHNLSLEYLKAGLIGRGVPRDHILTLPDRKGLTTLDLQISSFESDSVLATKSAINGHIVDPEATIAFISLTTDAYSRAAGWIGFLKKNYPGIEIIVGGKHLRREEIYNERGQRLRDPVELALSSEWPGLGALAAIDGDMGPALDYATAYNGSIGQFDARGFFHANSTARPVAPNDKGYFPRIPSIPFVLKDIGEGRSAVEVAFGSSCLNACDYCSTFEGRISFSREAMVRFFEEINARGEIVMVNLTDPNHFDSEKAKLLHVFRILREKKNRWHPMTTMLDPSILTSEKGLDLFYEIIKNSFFGFFFGVERVPDEVARKIGARLKRKTRSPQQIAAEKQRLRILISEQLPEIKSHIVRQTGLDGFYFNVSIASIVTPFETKQTALALAEEMLGFYGLRGDAVRVNIKLFPLAPYPGTAVRKRLVGEGLVADPENFHTFGNNFCNWTPSLGLGRRLIDEFALYLTHNEVLIKEALVRPNGRSLALDFQELVEKVFAGTLPERDEKARQDLLAVGFNE